MSGIKSQIDIMTCFIHFSFSSHTFLVHLILSLCPALQTKLYSWPLHKKKKTLNTQTVLFSSVSECLSLYLTNSGVHTEKRWSSVSTVLSKKSGLTLRCEWRCALLSLTYILTPSFTIHKHHSSTRCLMWKLHPHFLSTWEIFGCNPCAAGLRWGGYSLPCPAL